MSGPMTSSRAAPTMAGNSACSTSSTSSPGNAWQSASIASSTPPTSLMSCRTCSSCAACRVMFVPTTARSSSPRPCGSGLLLSVRRPHSSNQEAHGRTATARASTRSFATNCSTVKSSIASPRQRSSSKLGDATTTPSGRTHRSDINRRHRRPPSGLRRRPDRHRHLPRPWPKSRSYIKTETGPPNGVRPRSAWPYDLIKPPHSLSSACGIAWRGSVAPSPSSIRTGSAAIFYCGQKDPRSACVCELIGQEEEMSVMSGLVIAVSVALAATTAR